MFENFVYFQEVVKLSTTINYQLAFINYNVKTSIKILRKQENIHFVKHILLTLADYDFLAQVVRKYVTCKTKCAKKWFSFVFNIIKEIGASRDTLTDLLIAACINDQSHIIRYCIEKPDCKICGKHCIHGADIHAKDDKALIIAIDYNDICMIKYLLNHGANPHARNEYLIKYAIRNNNSTLFDYLLDCTDPRYHNDLFLLLAVESNDFYMVKRLLELGCDIHSGKDRAFISSVNCEDKRIREYLLSAGANVNAQKSRALTESVERNRLEIVKWLLSIHSRVNYLAIEAAVDNGNSEMVQLLVENSLGIEINYEIIASAIKYCADETETAKYLINNAKKIKYNNLHELEEALRYCDIEILKLLETRGLDIHLEDDFILVCSCKTDDLEMVKYLVENGANLNARNNEPLKVSIEHTSIDTFEYLIENGADIHFDNEYLLRKAVEENTLLFANYLVNCGAVVTVGIIIHAIQDENSEMIKCLLKDDLVIPLVNFLIQREDIWKLDYLLSLKLFNVTEEIVMLAVDDRNVKITQYLLNKQLKIDVVTSAIDNEDINTLDFLIDNRIINVNFGYIIAIQNGFQNMFEYFQDKVCDEIE